MTQVNAQSLSENTGQNYISQGTAGNRVKSSILDEMDVSIINRDDDEVGINNLASVFCGRTKNLLQSKDQTQSKVAERASIRNQIKPQNTNKISGSNYLSQDQTKKQTKDNHANDDKNNFAELGKHINNYAQQEAVVGVQNESSKTATPFSFNYFLNKEQYQNIILLMAVIMFILIFKSVISNCSCILSLQDNPLKDAVYILFREVVIVLTGAVILEALSYYQVIKFTKDNSIGIIYCILMALFLWTFLGLIMIYSAQRQVNRWRKYEEITSDYGQLEKIKKKYESIYYRDAKNGEPKFEKGFIEKIKYFVMRLEFIHPIFLPPLSESFLRKDFNFAQYLAYSYAKTLKAFFNTSWVSLFVIMILIDASKLAFLRFDYTEKIDGMQLLSILPPIFFLAVFLLFNKNFTNIQRVLYPHIKQSDGTFLKPEEINFQDNYDVVDPFTLYDNIPQPEYLDIHEDSADESIRQFEGEDRGTNKNYLEQDDEDSVMMNSASRRSEDSQIRHHYLNQWDIEERKDRASCCFMYSKQDHSNNCFRESQYTSLPNRHEKLFFCGRSGKLFSKLALQIFYILSIIYLSSYLVFSSNEIYQQFKNNSRINVTSLTVILAISPIVMLLILLIIIPRILDKFTIITNIEMMKDKELIEKVITEQKQERSKRSYRIYQVLKLIRREMAMELQQHIKDKRLRGFTKKQIIEQYELLDGQKSKSIKGDSIKSLIRLCGQELSKQEQNILLKKSKSRGDQLKYKDFSLAVELIINDVKVDAYYLVFNLFQLFFRGEEKIEFNQFITFFGEFVTYFNQEDIDGFLKEVQFIRRGSDEVYFQEIASMIRDDVELFPK